MRMMLGALGGAMRGRLLGLGGCMGGRHAGARKPLQEQHKRRKPRKFCLHAPHARNDTCFRLPEQAFIARRQAPRNEKGYPCARGERVILVLARSQVLAQRTAGRWREYPISTSRYGLGNAYGSLQTPLGRHRICAKIGEDMHPLTVFRARKPVGLLPPHPDPNEDWIVGRILWLEGLDTGKNRRGLVDTKRRCIYIHGTPFEETIGRPASNGCIRMRIADVLQVFARAFVGERVLIRAA